MRSTACCTRLRRGSASCRCCSTRSCRPRRSGCSLRSAGPICRSMGPSSEPSAAERGSANWGSSSRASRPRRRPPEAEAVIDTHCHLDACDPPVAELVGRARAAGVTRLATVGMNGPSIEHAITAAEDHDEVLAIVGRHPHESAGFDELALEEIERAAAHPRVRAIGETGLDHYRDYAPRDGRGESPGRATARGDRLAPPVAPAAAREAERAGERGAHGALRGRAARDRVRGAGNRRGRERRARLRRMTGEPLEPRQASLRRLRAFRIRPNRELGQNFLIDDNILRVIGAAAELDPADVVLEVGGGLGVLSEFLAPRVAHLHVVEVDRSLEPPLREALEPFGNATLHLTDAVRADFAELEPRPNKVVANLPYGVAATVLLKSIAELPDAQLWVAMMQREVADRLAAAPPAPRPGAAPPRCPP